MPCEVFLTTGKKTRVKNAFASNMSAGIKPVKAQMLNIIQSGRFFGALFGKLPGPLMKFGEFFLPPLSTMASASAIDVAIQRQMYGSRAEALGAGKGIILFISNQDMDYIIRIVK